MTDSATAAPVPRTTAGLREALLSELDNIRAGTSTPARANAIARLAGTSIETLRAELEMKRYLGFQGKASDSMTGDSVKL